MTVRTVVTAVALGLCAAACGGPEPADIVSSGTAPTTEATTTVPAPVEPSTTVGVAPTSVAVATTAIRRTTTSRAPVTTIARATSTTAAAAPVVVARCEDVPLAVEVATSRSVYRPGELPTGRYTLRNASGAPCLYRNYAFGYHVEDAAGRSVGSAGAGHTDGFSDSTLAAGGTLEVLDLSWDQRICNPTCSQAPPGTYTFRVRMTVGSKQFDGSAAIQLAA